MRQGREWLEQSENLSNPDNHLLSEAVDICLSVSQTFLNVALQTNTIIQTWRPIILSREFLDTMPVAQINQFNLEAAPYLSLALTTFVNNSGDNTAHSAPDKGRRHQI